MFQTMFFYSYHISAKGASLLRDMISLKNGASYGFMKYIPNVDFLIMEHNMWFHAGRVYSCTNCAGCTGPQIFRGPNFWSITVISFRN
jgi:hypothetical protein